MEKFKNSLKLVLYNAILTSLMIILLVAFFIYTKNPLEMPDSIIGLLTIAPLVICFISCMIVTPCVVISIKMKYISAEKKQLKGIYEMIMYLISSLAFIVLFDFLYRYLFNSDFAEKFALALQNVLLKSSTTFNTNEFDDFSKFPFLVQNLFSVISGLFFSTLLIYPLSNSIAKRLILTNKI